MDLSFNFFSTCRKRARDDDDDEPQSLPEAKKPYSLPFRNSPTTKHTRLFSQSKRARPRPLFTQTITPTDSEEENSPPFNLSQAAPIDAQIQGNAHSAPVVEGCPDLEMDMDEPQMLPSPQSLHEDMNLCSPTVMMLSPKSSPRTLLAPRVDSMALHDSSQGRLPTPIYGHFRQADDGLTDVDPIRPEPSALRSDKDIEYDQYLRSRRLPSPISEDEAMEFSPPQSTFANHSPPSSTPIRNTGAAIGGLRSSTRLAQPLSSPRPLKDGAKMMFSMGFRADCEMCRTRVPGHSNHVFRA